MVKLCLLISHRGKKLLSRRCGDALGSMPLGDFNEISHDTARHESIPKPSSRESVGARLAVTLICLVFAAR